MTSISDELRQIAARVFFGQTDQADYDDLLRIAAALEMEAESREWDSALADGLDLTS